MINIRTLLIEKFGVDKAILFTSMSRIIQAGGGLLTLLLISIFFSKEEQGFYYTFASVLAIQMFFELGLGGILTQFVAHEKAHLNWDSKGELIGEPNHLSRLSSLVHFCIKWYAFFSILLVVSLTVVGYIFFSKYSLSHDVNWKAPWLMVSIAAGLNLFISPWMAILQGLGKVKEMARVALIQQVLVLCITWLAMIFGAKLYLLSINLFVSFSFLTFVYMRTSFRSLFKSLAQNTGTSRISYKDEILPFQWRIAISWISGYFIFQLFNPVIFATEGAVTAGQMGMTLAALNAILSLTLSWTSTKIPLWSSYIATKNYRDLDHSFGNVLKQSTAICVFFLVCFSFFLFLLRYFGFSIFERFLPWGIANLMMITIVVNNIINAWATYLRCHKKEPFLIQAITIGALCAISTIFSAKYYGIQGIVVGYTSIVLVVSLPLSYYIFKKKKNLWHA